MSAAIMDNDWKKSPEYRELLQLMMPFGEEGNFFISLQAEIRNRKEGQPLPRHLGGRHQE